MSFVQRRNFLWILFLAGILLIAIVANATTLVHLRFQELVRLFLRNRSPAVLWFRYADGKW